MSFWKSEVQEIIKLDNTNDNLKEWKKSNIDVKLDYKEWNLQKYLDALSVQKKLLEKWKEVLDSYWSIKTLRDVLYEINYLTDTKKSILELKTSIENWTEFDIKTISKYTLSNYESLPLWKSYWIAKAYRDLDNPIEFNWFKIEGYIDYLSIVGWELVEKKLVIIDNPNLDKNDNISDKVVYSIDNDWKLILEENFQIEDWIYINENRWFISSKQNKDDLAKLKKEIPNHNEKWKVIDEDIERELQKQIENLPPLSQEARDILNNLSVLDWEESSVEKGDWAIDFTWLVDLLDWNNIPTSFEEELKLSQWTEKAMLDLLKKDKHILLKAIELRIKHLENIWGHSALIIKSDLSIASTWLMSY